MNRRTLLLFCFTAALAACASTKRTLYDTSAIQSVKMWTVDFLYEPGRTEQTLSREKGAETRVITEGRPRRDLKLRDDIAFALKDQHKIDASRTKRQGAGEIRLLPVDFRFGGFASLDVEISLPSGEVVGRVQIKNGDRNATFKDDDDFAEYAVNAIVGALRTGK